MSGGWWDALGTTLTRFRFGIGNALIEGSTTKLKVLNPDGSDTAGLEVELLEVVGNKIVLNVGDAHQITIQVPAGITGDWTFSLPVDDGSPGQALFTDGAGNTFWATVSGSTDKIGVDKTDLAFGSAGTVSMFTLPANAVIDGFKVIVDATFNGNPTISIGVAGNTSRYVPATAVNLKGAVGERFEHGCSIAPDASPQNLIITFAAGGATAGSARIFTSYSIPT